LTVSQIKDIDSQTGDIGFDRGGWQEARGAGQGDYLYFDNLRSELDWAGASIHFKPPPLHSILCTILPSLLACISLKPILFVFVVCISNKGPKKRFYLFIRFFTCVCVGAGEWYVDADTSMMYYVNNGTNAPPSDGWVAAQHDNVVSVLGDVGVPVRSVELSGLAFMHTKTTFMEPFTVRTVEHVPCAMQYPPARSPTHSHIPTPKPTDTTTTTTSTTTATTTTPAHMSAFTFARYSNTSCALTRDRSFLCIQRARIARCHLEVT
jgi:hypothetical protein